MLNSDPSISSIDVAVVVSEATTVLSIKILFKHSKLDELELDELDVLELVELELLEELELVELLELLELNCKDELEVEELEELDVLDELLNELTPLSLLVLLELFESILLEEDESKLEVLDELELLNCSSPSNAPTSHAAP